MKEITLIKGKMVALIDDEDFERLSKHKWYAEKTKHTFYAMSYFYNYHKKRKDHIRMHREVLRLTKRDQVSDHIDGNGLNNQKSNLRICTQGQNRFNSKMRNVNTSGYIGVSLYKSKKIWKNYDGAIFRSRIIRNGKEFCVGYFRTAKEAAIARDLKAKELHGEFAYLNFK